MRLDRKEKPSKPALRGFFVFVLAEARCAGARRQSANGIHADEKSAKDTGVVGPSFLARSHAARVAPWLLAVASTLALVACQPKHIEVGEEPELDYPECASLDVDAAPPSGTLTTGALQGTEGMIEKGLVERYELRKMTCGHRYRGTLKWGGGHTEVELVYDPHWKPLRAWRRISQPGPRGTEKVDVRRYELRTPEPRIRKVTMEGVLGFEHLRGKFPQVLVAPSRGSVVPWVRAARLEQGQKERMPALDLREPLEKMRDVTLKREADRYQPEFGQTVRVYTLYGREAYFFDEENRLLGDMAGMRPLADGKTDPFFVSQEPMLPPSL